MVDQFHNFILIFVHHVCRGRSTDWIGGKLSSLPLLFTHPRTHPYIMTAPPTVQQLALKRASGLDRTSVTELVV